jgi:6-phosphogluconate dehydrogenase
MGANMVRRLQRAGHTCVVYDRSAASVEALVREGATGSATIDELVAKTTPPRCLCLMIPAAYVDAVIEDLAPRLTAGDTIVDGGNSHFADDIGRARMLADRGLHYVDMGTSGGVWGLDRGYCLMIGGEAPVVSRLTPLFAALAPAPDRGWLHCGPAGAGHFVKMVHNGIEYGVMAAYAEGLNLLRHANAGVTGRETDAETTPLRHPERYQYEFDVAAIAEVWRHGSVIQSWLLDLTADALREDPGLAQFAGRVSDSGEGRWTLEAANDVGVPAHVIASALFARFASRGQAGFQNQVLSAMRWKFGGHGEKT